MIKKWLLISLVLVGMIACATAGEKIHIVTTLPDFQDLAQQVGGDLVEVTAIAKGFRDPHHVEIKPSDILKLRKADVLIVNGINLDDWIYPLLRKSQNTAIQSGAPGFIDASEGIDRLEVPHGAVDRSMGDIHPGGNPHYTISPVAMKTVVGTIAAHLSTVYPQYASVFEKNATAYQEKLSQKIAEWQALLAKQHPQRVVVYHSSWAYFFKDFNLSAAGYIEPKPGIAPSPSHLAALIEKLNQNKESGVVLREVFQNASFAEYVAQHTGLKYCSVATSVGGTAKAKDYLSMMDALVQTIATN